MGRRLAEARVVVGLASVLQNTLGDGLAAAVTHPTFGYTLRLTSGIGHKQANRAWQAVRRKLVAGASETLDLYGFTGLDIGAGAGKDGLGLPLVNEEVVAIVVVNENRVEEAGQLEVTPATTAGWTPIGEHTVGNGGALRGRGLLLKVAPGDEAYRVVDGVSHRVTFKAVGGAVEYSLYLLFRHDFEESSSSSPSSLSSVSSQSSLSSHSSSSQSSSSSSRSSQSSSSSSRSSQSSYSSGSASEQSSASSTSSSSTVYESESSLSSYSEESESSMSSYS